MVGSRSAATLVATPSTPSSSKIEKNFKVVVRVRPPLETEMDPMIPFSPVVEVNSDSKSLAILEYLGAEAN